MKPLLSSRLLLSALVLLLLLPAGARAADDPAEEAGRQVLIRWMEAIGGAAEVNSLRTAFIKCTIDFGTGAPPMPVLVRSAGGLYRLEYAMPRHGTLVQAFDGMVAWQHNAQLGFGFLSAGEHAVNQVMTDFRAPVRVGSVYPSRRREADETVGERTLQVVRMRTADGREEKWYFDPATGYRVRVEMPGTGGSLVIEFEDFRRAFGAQVREPFRTIRIEQGRRVVVQMELALYNEPMDPGLFNAPRGPVDDNRQIESLLHRNALLRGSAALAEVQSRVIEQLVQVTSSGVEIPTRVYQRRPNLITTRQTVPGMGEVWQGYDGRIGWAWSEVEGFREMDGAELVQMVAAADLEGPLKLSRLCPLRRLLPDRVDGDRRLVGIAMSSLAGPEGDFYFDPKTDELVQVDTYVQAGADGRLKVTAEFGDYRRVDGMLIAHRIVMTHPAMRIVTLVQSVEHNLPLDDAVFAPRRE